jgi:hypothetical protein
MINFAFGCLSALVLIQFFPRLSYVGAAIVKRGKALLTGGDGA